MKPLLLVTILFAASCTAGDVSVPEDPPAEPPTESEPADSQYREQSSECAQDVQICVQDCLDANGLDSGAALGECLAGCGGDFEACVPDLPDNVPDLDDLDLGCVEQAGACFASCAADALACEPPELNCDTEAIQQCIEDNQGEPLAAIECARELAEDCIGQLDLSCYEDSLSCFEICGPDLAECFGG